MHKLYDSCQVDEMNTRILSGISRHLGRHTVRFVDNLWKHSFQSLPEEMREKDLITYDGYSIVPIHERTLKGDGVIYSPGRKGKKGYTNHPIKQSDSIPVRFKFSILEDSGPVEAYINMSVPFIRRNGICNMSGTAYYISPILSDIILTPNERGVFIKFDNIKFSVNAEDVDVFALRPDEDKFHLRVGRILTSTDSKHKRGGAKHGGNYGSPKLPLHLYILYRYGLKKLYKEPIDYIHHSEIDKYHKAGWYIYGTSNTKPRRHNLWVKSDYYLATKKQPNAYEYRIISSIIHLLHHFPKTGTDLKDVLGTKDEQGFWEVSVGRMLYTDTKTADFRLRGVRQDLYKFETYINGRLSAKLEKIGFKPTLDYIAFLEELSSKIDNMKSSHLEYINNFSYREIDIYYYLLYNYIEGINKVVKEISKSWKSSKGLTRTQFHAITTKDYSNESILRKLPKAPIGLTLSKLEASSDNLFFKMTSILIPQEVGDNVNRKSSSRGKAEPIPENMRGLHGSFPYIGNVLKLSKSIPVALASINPFLNIGPAGNFIFTKDDIRTMSEIDKVLNKMGRDKLPSSVVAEVEIADDE